MIRMPVVSFAMVIIIMLASACSRQDAAINYDELTAEELEILYQQGHRNILNKLCDAYAKWYLERPEAEWWLDGSEYKREAGLKFVDYCQKAYSLENNKKAADHLRSYYLSLIDKQPLYLGEFIFYLKGSENTKIYESFVEYDSHFVALIEHSVMMIDKILSMNRYKFSDNTSEMIALFDRYRKDLKRIEPNLFMFSAEIRLIISMFDNLIESLGKARSDFEMGWIIGEFRGQIKTVGTFVTNISRIIDNPESLNKDILVKISDILAVFKQNKEKYFKQYAVSFLEEGTMK